MQISPWTTELRFPVGHRDGAARWSDLLPANTGKPKYFTLPSRKNRNFKTAIISTVCLALLALVLSVYFCRSPRGLQKPSAPVLRRLANNGGDESFQELYDLIESFCEDESMVSSMSQEILQSRGLVINTGSRKRGHSASNQDEEAEQISSTSQEVLQSTGLVINTGSRKRGHSASNQDEEAEQAKRPLIEGEHQKRAEGLSAPPDPSASSSAQASKAQQQTVLAQAHQLSGHLHSNQEGYDEVNRPSVAPGVGTVSDEGISSANFAVLEGFFAEEDWVDQWFLDYILDPSPTSSPQSDLDHSADSQDAGQETTANAAGQIHPSSSPEPESPSSGAHDSASEGDQLPVSKADDMQECQSSAADESASEDDQLHVSKADDMQGSQSSATDESEDDQLHVSKADDMQGSQSSATDESASEDDQLPVSKANDMQGSQSSAADESASEGDQLPGSKADDMQECQKTSEVSEEQGNNPASLQESPPPAKPKEGQGGSPSQVSPLL
ncbi:hypothetical protein EPH_0035170 [Eimeria praecox]|uniref:Uncharacterized protein n=1 Tax=Eimeria praecox TaxID=51316 RepID=U6G5A4_9EIME|nr:hypothetical protein EPH_0035170 [Eimeria praecox]